MRGMHGDGSTLRRVSCVCVACILKRRKKTHIGGGQTLSATAKRRIMETEAPAAAVDTGVGVAFDGVARGANHGAVYSFRGFMIDV